MDNIEGFYIKFSDETLSEAISGHSVPFRSYDVAKKAAADIVSENEGLDFKIYEIVRS